jgi:hypothetical protein
MARLDLPFPGGAMRKNFSKRAATLASVAFIGLLLSAGASIARQNKKQVQIDAALSEARRVSAELTDKVRNLLLSELEKGGYENAVRVCAEIAQDTTQQYSQKTGHYLRRVSLGFRNRKDVPDEYEQRKLESFDRLNREQKLESDYYEVVNERGRRYLRYMKPILTGTMCLKCHGQLDEIPYPVIELLREKYPNDRALGYRVGDVRGAVSVKIALPLKRSK